MNNQSKALGEKRLKHQSHLGSGRIDRLLSRDIELIVAQPRRS